MYNSKNPTAIRSQEIIIETFIRLLNEETYNNISVKLIILESGISRKTFYRNFDSKEDVLSSACTKNISRYITQLTSIGSYTFSQMLEVAFIFCEENREFLLLLNKNRLLPYVLNILNQAIYSAYLKKAPASTAYENYAVSFNVGAIWNVISLWIAEGMTKNRKELTEYLSKYIDTGMSNSFLNI